MSYVVQKKIANVFKKQVSKNGFDHVSVSSIMRATNIRRQTFYECFLDKYDLLRWQVNDTLEEVIDNNIDYLPWQSIMKLFIYEVDANRRYYFECLSQHEVDVSDLFALHLTVLLAHIMDRKKLNKNKKARASMWITCLGISNSIIHNTLSNEPVDYELLVVQAIYAVEFSFDVS